MIENEQIRRRKNMSTSLVIMAAGMGSRYGGNKQVDGVGPHGEILMEYGIYDAVRAGFDKIVFLIKPEILDLVKKLCGDDVSRLKTKEGKPVQVAYAFQTYESVPDFYTVPPERTKPFGTCHAVLSTRGVTDGPFCVINADDYYGVDAYRVMYKHLQTMQEKQAVMVGYLLKNTVTEHGSVARGVCRVEQDRLIGVKENLKVQLFSDGSIANMEDGIRRALAPDTIVSMNFWGFTQGIYEELDRYWIDFLHGLEPGDCKSECLLPNMVGQRIQEKQLQVSVLHSKDRWFGMTYQEDRAAVAEELKKLHAAGIYPENLYE